MWEKALAAQAEPLVPLTLTNKCNMQHVYKSKQTCLNFKYAHFRVMCEDNQDNLTDFTNRKLRLKTTEEVMDDPFEPTWKQSLSMLGSYIDILAPELLAIWDIREEVPVPLSAAPHQKVLNWLESATSQHATQSQDEPEYTFIPINTQELISVSQEKDITYIDDTDMLQEILLPKVISKPTRRKNT